MKFLTRKHYYNILVRLQNTPERLLIQHIQTFTAFNIQLTEDDEDKEPKIIILCLSQIKLITIITGQLAPFNSRTISCKGCHLSSHLDVETSKLKKLAK